MTPEEHNQKSIELRRALTQARTVLRTCSTAEKREAKRKEEAASAALRRHQLNFHELTCYELISPTPGVIPTLGTTVSDILDAFCQAGRDHFNRRITEAAIVGGNLRFRWQESGKLGVVHDEIDLRDATKAEYRSLKESVAQGTVEIFTKPLYGATSSRPRIVLHQATGMPLAPTGDAECLAVGS